MILGHAHPAVVAAITARRGTGTAFGAPTALEVGWPSASRALVPSIEMVRLVNSGTEATMAALRLARGRHRTRRASSSSRAAITGTATASS